MHFPAISMCPTKKCGEYLKKLNVDFVKNITRRKNGPPDSIESVGHIQCYCPALHLPRIAIHHGIWRELMYSIRKSPTKQNDAKEPVWQFPPTLSPEAHAE